MNPEISLIFHAKTFFFVRKSGNFKKNVRYTLLLIWEYKTKKNGPIESNDAHGHREVWASILTRNNKDTTSAQNLQYGILVPIELNNLLGHRQVWASISTW